MALHQDQREFLERHHHFAEWQGSENETGTRIQNFVFKGDELPGWELVKSKFNDTLNPPRLDTFWQPIRGSADELLAIRIIEQPSVVAARETLLGVLGQVQSAAILRRKGLDIGDVVFGQEFMLVFARNNLVISIRNAGSKLFPVTEWAKRVDTTLIEAMHHAR